MSDDPFSPPASVTAVNDRNFPEREGPYEEPKLNWVEWTVGGIVLILAGFLALAFILSALL
jgi:hypothetical protein